MSGLASITDSSQASGQAIAADWLRRVNNKPAD